MLSACSQKEIQGAELIEKSQAEMEKLNSATIIVKNEKQNETEQSFSFIYNEDGTVTYLYIATIEETNYIEYNNGKEMFVLKNGQVSKISNKDEGFVAYSRDNPHENSGKGMILFNNNLVDKSNIVEVKGKTIVTHEYDVKKMKKLDDKLDNVRAFTIIYHFDENGNLEHYNESTDIENKGVIHNTVYRFDIKEKNQIAEIEKPSIFAQ